MAKSVKTKAKRALGRGLSELMANAALSEEFSSPDSNKADSKKQISIELIRPNKNQPRKIFSKNNRMCSTLIRPQSTDYGLCL